MGGGGVGAGGRRRDGGGRSSRDGRTHTPPAHLLRASGSPGRSFSLFTLFPPFRKPREKALRRHVRYLLINVPHVAVHRPWQPRTALRFPPQLTTRGFRLSILHPEGVSGGKVPWCLRLGFQTHKRSPVRQRPASRRRFARAKACVCTASGPTVPP